MAIIMAIGIILFGFLAIAGVIMPFLTEMMPAIVAVGSSDIEIAMWGLMPILLLVILLPAAILTYRRYREK